MNDLQYYTKEINDCRETQCQSDLLNGKIKITDVPFAFRGHDEYTATHKYARGLVDEKERYYLYWKIAECMESDMVNLCKQQLTLKTVEYQIASQHLTFLKNPDISIWTTEPLN